MTRKRKAAIGYALIAIGFGMFMAGPIAVIAAGFGGIVVALPAVLGFAVIAAGGLLLTAGSESPRARVSTPDGGVRKIGCPNCGASPSSGSDENGVTTCEYCNTRFLMP